MVREESVFVIDVDGNTHYPRVPWATRWHAEQRVSVSGLSLRPAAGSNDLAMVYPHVLWCRERESNPHGPYDPRDFKSPLSTDSNIPACSALVATTSPAAQGGPKEFSPAGLVRHHSTLYQQSNANKINTGSLANRWLSRPGPFKVTIL